MGDGDRTSAPTGATGEVTVVLAPALVALFPSAQTRLTVHARTVDDVIDALDTRWPGMGDRLRDSFPRVRPHIAIFYNGQRATLAMPIAPGSEVFVLTAISGG